ncbi:hypothetical protein Q5752_001281 [Cryptotrichosporon argae]
MGHHPPFDEVEASRAPFDAAFKPTTTRVPQPGFEAGGGLNSLPYASDFAPAKPFTTIVPEDKAGADIYKLLISAVTPRPIAFVSTLGPDGAANLAPMSYFNIIGHNPPALMVSVAAAPKNSDGLKDTNSNIRTTREFCVSIISEPFLEAANYTSIDAPYGVSEWALSGLTQRPSETVKPPHVAESGVSMECELMHWYDLKTDAGDVTGTVCIGRIRRFHIKEGMTDPEDPMKVLVEKLRPVSRLGGIAYGRTTQMAEVPRPVWEQVKDTPAVRAALEEHAKKL